MIGRPFYMLAGAGTRSGRAQRPAFSLIELLVVVGIITLLIAIMLPSLRTSVRQASSTVCMHNLKQIAQAIDYYEYDNNGWVPSTTSGSGRSVSVWFQKLLPRYLNDPNVLVCPEDPLRAWLLQSAVYVSQAAESAGSSYGMNEFILGSPDQFLCNLERNLPRRPLDTLLIADMGPDVVSTGSAGYFDEPSRGNGVVSWHDGYTPGSPSARPSWITRRHLGGINVLTIGGGVQKVSTDELMRTTIQPYYPNCAAGDCTLCVSLGVPHYSFAVSRTFWWTGPVPTP